MPLLAEDPAHLSKSRLRSDLVAHNVALPPSKSRKEVYVELHLKHIEQKTTADFSSDEDEQTQQADGNQEENPEIPDPGALTDDELKAALLKRGVKAGPIVASTRALYEKKLLKVLQPDGHDRRTRAENGALYSDSEDEERGGEDDAELDCEEETQTVQQPDQALQEHRQVKVRYHSQNGYFAYPQCFLLSSRLRVPTSRNRKPKWNSRNVVRSSERIQSRCSKISAGISSASAAQHSGLGSGMEIQRSLSSPKHTASELSGSKVQEHRPRSDGPDLPVLDEHTRKNQSLYYTPKASPCKMKIKKPVEDAFKDLLPATGTTPTGIYASRRRPIKGAAGRPVQYVYSDAPASPATLQRREVARRLVPVHIRLLVFLAVVCLLYFIYVCVEENSLSPFAALLDNLNQGQDGEDGLLRQSSTPALSGQE